MFTPKRQRTEPRTTKTPEEKILNDMRSGNHIDDGKSFKALCNCIVRAVNEEGGEEDFECLEALLHEGADPNYNEHSILEITAGSPLYLAIKLNVPKAVEILLQYRASLVQKYESKTPLQLAFELGDSEILEIIQEHIAHLESQSH